MNISSVELITKKRDGKKLNAAEIEFLVNGFVRGQITDYQMSSWAMAVFFRGMSFEETAALTMAMRDSGRVVSFGTFRAPLVDKHSTGGVGDKASICLAPLVAACGVYVPMVSGRGLGHTGGTLDKLEAIPGFKIQMSIPKFVSQVKKLGCALIGQTAEIAPADKRLYALRDVTATVESIPLITSSILSKKLAEGIDALVLDVKVGCGAFMKTFDDARQLAESLVRVGALAKKKVSAILTDMNTPLGHTVGNALETYEAMEVLHGKGPEDLIENTFVLAIEMLRHAGITRKESEARRLLDNAIKNGSAIKKMESIVRAQGGDPRIVKEPDRLPKAKHILEVRSPKTGYIQTINALEIGLSSVAIGAGRTRADQKIDPAAGIRLNRKPGDPTKKGDALAEIHASNRETARAIENRVLAAFSFTRNQIKPSPLVLGRV